MAMLKLPAAAFSSEAEAILRSLLMMEIIPFSALVQAWAHLWWHLCGTNITLKRSPMLGAYLAILLMALLGVTFGTLSMLAATVASFKAVGDGAEVLVLICTLTGDTTLTLLRCTAFVRQELLMGSGWGLLVHNAGIKWFVVVWPTVLTSCTVEIPGLDDKAMLVEYKVLEVPVTKQTLLIKNTLFLRFKAKD